MRIDCGKSVGRWGRKFVVLIKEDVLLRDVSKDKRGLLQ
jgi:hypothetical protein